MIHRLRGSGGLKTSVWVDEGIAVTSLRSEGTELLGRPGPDDLFGRDDVALGMLLLAPWANRLAVEAYRIGTRHADVAAAGERVLRDRAGLPIHGVAGRDPGWRVTSAAPDALAAQRAWTPASPAWSAFPVEHLTSVTLRLVDGALSVATTVTATSDDAVPVALGWHPYLAPPGGDRTTWTLALPATRPVVADERGLPTATLGWRPASRERLRARAYDAGFQVEAPAEASVGSARWLMTVRLDAGYRCLQVYAPADRDVVCLEPMAAPANALVSGTSLPFATPGTPFTARFSLRAESID